VRAVVDRKSIKSLLDQPVPVRRGPTVPQDDYSKTVLNPAAVEVVFRDHKQRLREFIASHDVLLGAVAWLTDEDILHDLAAKRTSILVQKEDFLRPDLKGSMESRRAAYGALYCGLYGAELPGRFREIQYSEAFEVAPIRCVGNSNKAGRKSSPRMHNKFLIGCEYFEQLGVEKWAEHNLVLPKAVWTGSFNFTYNAQASFENAVIIPDKRVALSYCEEWSQIYLFSEDLNWSEEWVSPDYWIGT
jgi:hypothetical protein